MLILARCGKLDAFAAFEDKTNLARYLDELPWISSDLMVVYRSVLRRGLDPELSRSVRSLLRRSRAAAATQRSGIRKAIAGLRRYVPAPIPPASRCNAQHSNLGRREKQGPQQPLLGQLGLPYRIKLVGLGPTRHITHPPGVDQLHVPSGDRDSLPEPNGDAVGVLLRPFGIERASPV